VDKAAPVQLAAVDARTVEQAAPMLPPMLVVDPAVFRPRLRRR
jgi:hypothetical protein